MLATLSRQASLQSPDVLHFSGVRDWNERSGILFGWAHSWKCPCNRGTGKLAGSLWAPPRPAFVSYGMVLIFLILNADSDTSPCSWCPNPGANSDPNYCRENFFIFLIVPTDISYNFIQWCVTITIYYGSGSDFWQVTVPVLAPYLDRKKHSFQSLAFLMLIDTALLPRNWLN